MSALHRLNQGDLRLEQAKPLPEANSATRLEWAAEWEQPGKAVAGWMRTRFESDPETGDILVQQEGKLASYAWGAKKKVAAIPIDRAMDLVLAELTRPKPPEKKVDEKGAKHEKR